MSREQAIDTITEFYESGKFLSLLNDRVKIASESQTPDGYPNLALYLEANMIPYLKEMGFLPNLGGSIPNDCFALALGLPTLWIPHSYPACLQHGPDEHMLGSVALESLQLMTGIFWDLAEQGKAVKEQRDG